MSFGYPYYGYGVSVGYPAYGYYSSYGYGFGDYPYYGYRYTYDRYPYYRHSAYYPRYPYPYRRRVFYPYHVYYPYYRSHVYISSPYGYVSHYYEPPYSTYYSEPYEGGAYVDTSPPPEGESLVRRVIRPAAEAPSVGEETAGVAALSQLPPARFNFTMGYLHFASRQYEDANEFFYVATLEDPESDIARLFLAVSLFSIGEYEYAAEYVRLAMDDWEDFLAYDWDVRQLYGNRDDFEKHRNLLAEAVELHASSRDERLLLAFIQYHSGDRERAGRNWEALEDLDSDDPLDQGLVSRYLVASNLRDAPRESPRLPPDPAVARFLAEPSAADIPELPLR